MSEGFKNDIEKLVASTESGIRASHFEKKLSEASKSGDLAGLHSSAGQIAEVVAKRKGLIMDNRYDRSARDKDLRAITGDTKLAAKDKKKIGEILEGLGHRKSLLAKKETPKPSVSPKVKEKNRRMPYNFSASSGLNSGVNNSLGAGGGIQPTSRPNVPKLVV